MGEKKGIKNAFDQLKNSAMFNLSLSSKELFHSNFLSYLLEKYQENEARGFFERLCKKSDWKSYKIYREKNNFDLSVRFKESNNQHSWLIIENKVKSIPNEGQLDGYKQKALKLYKDSVGNKFVLLSIHEFNDYDVWKNIDYFELGRILKDVYIDSKIVDSYDKFIINDYICFIENLSKIHKEISINKDKSKKLFLDKEIIVLSEKARILDLILKSRARDIENILKDEIWANFPENNLEFSSSLQRSGALCDLFITIKNDFKLFISLQNKKIILGMESKYFDEKREKNKMKWSEIGKKLLNDNLWFDFGPEYINFIGPLGKRKTTYEGWCSFHNQFFYKYINLEKINEETTHTISSVQDIVDFFKKQVDNAEKNRAKILEVFNNS